jgi:hypothetical protein
MNIPLWLLKLLPMWSFLCPKCKREVKQKSRRCPYCNENYGIPLRVPPRVLKDKKALEGYVHQHIFPRVSASQREYLTQFFTVLFSDGFEAGDFTAWTGVYDTAGCTSTVEGLHPHHGSHNGKFTGNSEGTAGAYKTLTAAAIVCLRAYTQITAMPVSGGSALLVLHQIDETTNGGGASSDYACAAIQLSGGSLYWATFVRASLYLESVASNPQINTWYCVELLRDKTNQKVTLWVDGVQKVAVTGLSLAGNAQEVAVGINYENFSSPAASTAYVDCVVVADTRVYCEKVPIVNLKSRGGYARRKLQFEYNLKRPPIK